MELDKRRKIEEEAEYQKKLAHEAYQKVNR